MKRLLVLFMVLGLVAAACGDDDSSDDGGTTTPEEVGDDGDDGEMALDELNVAYFLEWPTANQVAQAEQTYDAELVPVRIGW